MRVERVKRHVQRSRSPPEHKQVVDTLRYPQAAHAVPQPVSMDNDQQRPTEAMCMHRARFKDDEAAGERVRTCSLPWLQSTAGARPVVLPEA